MVKYKINFSYLFIDSSNMKNYMESELIGENYYNKFKSAAKLEIITPKKKNTKVN